MSKSDVASIAPTAFAALCCILRCFRDVLRGGCPSIPVRCRRSASASLGFISQYNPRSRDSRVEIFDNMEPKEALVEAIIEISWNPKRFIERFLVIILHKIAAPSSPSCGWVNSRVTTWLVIKLLQSCRSS